MINFCHFISWVPFGNLAFIFPKIGVDIVGFVNSGVVLVKKVWLVGFGEFIGVETGEGEWVGILGFLNLEVSFDLEDLV